MRRPISRKMHGIGDYGYIPTVAFASKLFGFEKEKNAVLLTHVFSSVITTSATFTRAEWGPIPLMPFKYHLLIDFLVGAAAISVPWLFGFAKNKNARNFFLFIGVLGVLMPVLSEPENMD